MEEVVHQIYIDPYKCLLVDNGMHLEVMVLWDSVTRMKMVCDFKKRINRKWDRWSLISLINNIIYRSGYKMRMTKSEFINMQIKNELFPGVDIKVEILSF